MDGAMQAYDVLSCLCCLSAASCSALLASPQLPVGAMPGSCNKTIPTGFSCLLELAPGYVSATPPSLTCINGSFVTPWPVIQGTPQCSHRQT